MGARSLRAIHIDWQAEHEADGAAFLRERKNALGIRAETLTRNSLDRRRDPAIRIADGDPDRLGAEIETDQCAALRQKRRSVGEFQHGHGLR